MTGSAAVRDAPCFHLNCTAAGWIFWASCRSLGKRSENTLSCFFYSRTKLNAFLAEEARVTCLHARLRCRCPVGALGLYRRCHHCQRLGLARRRRTSRVQRARQRSQGAVGGRVRVVHSHTADNIGALAQTNTGKRWAVNCML